MEKTELEFRGQVHDLLAKPHKPHEMWSQLWLDPFATAPLRPEVVLVEEVALQAQTAACGWECIVLLSAYLRFCLHKNGGLETEQGLRSMRHCLDVLSDWAVPGVHRLIASFAVAVAPVMAQEFLVMHLHPDGRRSLERALARHLAEAFGN